MTKETVYKSFFEIVDEVIEWELDEKSNKCTYYINGLLDMTHELLKKLDEEDGNNCSK